MIAIVDAYDYPNALADFNTFSAMFGLPTESGAGPVVQTVYTNTTAFLAALYNRFLTAQPPAFRDITTGSDGLAAQAGWDFGTGAGAPLGPASF